MSGQLNWSFMFLHWFNLDIITPVPKLSDAELRDDTHSWACFFFLIQQLHEAKGARLHASNGLTFLRNEETERWKDSVCLHKSAQRVNDRVTQNALVFYLDNDTQRWTECYIVSPRGKMLPFFLNDGEQICLTMFFFNQKGWQDSLEGVFSESKEPGYFKKTRTLKRGILRFYMNWKPLQFY